MIHTLMVGVEIETHVQHGSISIADILEITQSCTKPSMLMTDWKHGHKANVTTMVIINITSHERYGASIHRFIGCLLNRLFRVVSKKTSKVPIFGYLWGESTDD